MRLARQAALGRRGWIIDGLRIECGRGAALRRPTEEKSYHTGSAGLGDQALRDR
jgi:hypothetical protein